DIRPAPQAELRLKEAAKLGFRTAVVPPGMKLETEGLELLPIRDVAELAAFAGGAAQPKRRIGVVE
ncbi:MAG TPA: hypothetical protein VN932_08495, partial [Rhizomicrobium sp.]|nr:hypothetical protein [Rhizomicrobium sp.]